MYISATIIAVIAVITVLTFNYANTLNHIIYGFIGIILTATVFVGSIIIPLNVIVDGNDHAVTIAGHSIYYDESSDKYFVVITNNWNPFKIYYREYLDEKEVEKIIEVDKIVNEWN